MQRQPTSGGREREAQRPATNKDGLPSRRLQDLVGGEKRQEQKRRQRKSKEKDKGEKKGREDLKKTEG